MFGYMFKNLPAQYVFAGYGVRKSLTVMTSNVNGAFVYDIYLFTYLDNYLSFFLQMEDGTYKQVESGEQVSEATVEDVISKHLFRGNYKSTDADDLYDRNKLIGVFGLRNIETLMKQVDEISAKNGLNEIKLEAIMDVKSQYMGSEITGIINKFNKLLGYEKDVITVPPITFGPEDTFRSLIGDEMDYFDLISNKDADVIVHEFKMLDDVVDGVGNLKDGNKVRISKDENGNIVSVCTIE